MEEVLNVQDYGSINFILSCFFPNLSWVIYHFGRISLENPQIEFILCGTQGEFMTVSDFEFEI